jgi:hypothetical protein
LSLANGSQWAIPNQKEFRRVTFQRTRPAGLGRARRARAAESQIEEEELRMKNILFNNAETGAGAVGVVEGTSFQTTEDFGDGSLATGWTSIENPNNKARTGSNNLIVGTASGRSSYGGLVAGNNDFVNGSYAASFGLSNTASGTSSLAAGHANIANGSTSSATGGGSLSATVPQAFSSLHANLKQRSPQSARWTRQPVCLIDVDVGWSVTEPQHNQENAMPDARPIVPINKPGLFDPSVTPAQAVLGEPPWPTSAGPSAPKRRSLVRALAPSLNVRPRRGVVWGLFLAIAVLSAMSLPMGSTAHAADRISVGSVYLPPPCPLTLCLGENSDGSLTASSLWDIGPTPYYISVFNETTGARLAICGTGTSCTTSPYIGPPLNECYTYAAFVGGWGASIPPSPVQRSSAKRTRCNYLR